MGKEIIFITPASDIQKKKKRRPLARASHTTGWDDTGRCCRVSVGGCGRRWEVVRVAWRVVDVADKRLALGIDLLGLAAPHRRLALVVEKLAQGVAIGMGKEIRERRERERDAAVVFALSGIWAAKLFFF